MMIEVRLIEVARRAEPGPGSRAARRPHGNVICVNGRSSSSRKCDFIIHQFKVVN